MKYGIVFFLFCFTSVLQAQVSVALIARADYAAVFHSPSLESDLGTYSRPFATHNSFGLEVVYPSTNRSAVVLGVEYASSGSVAKFVVDPTACDCHFLSSTNAVEYNFVALPVGYRWYKDQNQWRFYSQVSLIPMAYLETKSRKSVDDYKTQKLIEQSKDFRDFHLASSAAIGIQKSLLKTWYFGLQTTFRVHLTPLTNQRSKERLWTAGLQLNVGKQLRTK